MTLAENLRKARHEAGLSQRQAARASEVHYTSICLIETGKRPNPSIQTLGKLARAYGVSVSSLVVCVDANREVG